MHPGGPRILQIVCHPRWPDTAAYHHATIHSTPTHPAPQVNFVRHTHSSPRWSGGSAVLAEFGSVQLEMRTLTYHTGDPQYNRRAQHVMNVVRRHLPPDGLVPTYLDPETGAWNSDHITLGALGDSYYEYLLKQWLLSGKTDTRYKEMFEQAADSIINKLVKPTGSGGAGMYLAEMKRGAPLSKMDHLACFAGGMFALASHHIPDKREQYLKVCSRCSSIYGSRHVGRDVLERLTTIGGGWSPPLDPPPSS